MSTTIEVPTTISTTIPTTLTNTLTTTELVPTTLTSTTTFTEVSTFVTSFPVTVTDSTTIYTTQTSVVTTTAVSTFTTVSTLTTVRELTDTVTNTVTNTQFNTVTQLTTLPASTITAVVTTVLPPVTVTTTKDGQVITSVIPGPTVTTTTTRTLPPVTVTVAGPTVTRDISICPAPTNTGAVPKTQNTNTKTGQRRLWGCDPGFVCNQPKPSGCNLWATAPADDFLCDPKYCVPAPFYPRVDWGKNKTGYYPPTEGYFNLNPNAFGLSYDIFAIEEIVTKINGHKTTITTGNWASQTSITHFPPAPTSTITTTRKHYRRDSLLHGLWKRDGTITPPVCYGICNTAYLEAQHVGLTDALCEAGSPFTDMSENCMECIAANGLDIKLTLRQYLGPAFEQFWGYCDIQPPQSQVSSSDLPPQTQVTSEPPVESSSQAPPNTNTSPVPITPSTTVTSTSEPPTPSSTTEIPTPTSSTSTAPPESTEEPVPSSTEESVPSSTPSEAPYSSTPPTPTAPPASSSSTLKTTTTGKPATSSIATAAAGRAASGSPLGSMFAALLAAVLFL